MSASCVSSKYASTQKEFAVDDRDRVPSNAGVVTKPRQEIGHPPIHRRTDLGALQIDLCLIAAGDSLLVLRLSHGGIGLIGLSVFNGLRQIGHHAAPRCLSLRILGRGPSLRDSCFSQLERDPVVRRIDHQQQIALVHELIVAHG
ncbi:hypothetical protein [Bradyrhizobium diazoefficiens]|uniref:hypothetical protein n=1 Tax=Bradyrhizobium diazoefficiens TaxID=1355477 RepID=UPI001FEF17F5|nr:hypothetical protein [Bradyrhizobium diazoefficiens]